LLLNIGDRVLLAQRGSQGTSESDWTVSDDNSSIEELMQQHNTFTNILQTRLTKLQVIMRDNFMTYLDSHLYEYVQHILRK